MLGHEHETIAALATPAGVGGVGIVRLSGPDAIAIVARLVGRGPEQLRDRVMTFAEVRSGGERLDDVLVVAMRGPHSFTGEDVAEIQGHGGPINMARLLRAVLAEGARPAAAGEFTRRALANGRMDLVKAEALLDVIEATSERAWRLAQRQLGGELGDEVRALRERGTAVLAEVEAHIDFPEDDLGDVVEARLRGELAEITSRLEQLVRSYELGRALRDGIDVALIGPTNAGKSSLFNVLVGRERAVVDEEHGTTRDYVEERIVIDGLPMCIIDTAGARTEGSRAEQKGIDLGRQRVESADIVVLMQPVDGPGSVVDAGSAKQIRVLSKADLGGVAADGLRVSAKTGAGVDELRARLVELALGDVASAETRQVITNERQRDSLAQACQVFGQAERSLGAQPLEVVAIEIREGTGHLASVMGEAVGEEVLDSLFARFCIGK